MAQDHVTPLRDARMRTGLSQQALADLAGVHLNTIGLLERGEMAPSVPIALRIVEVLRSRLGEPLTVEAIFGAEPTQKAS